MKDFAVRRVKAMLEWLRKHELRDGVVVLLDAARVAERKEEKSSRELEVSERLGTADMDRASASATYAQLLRRASR